LLALFSSGVLAQTSEEATEPQADAKAAAVFGAIAFTADGSYSTTWKRASKKEAEDKVLNDCKRFRRGECQIVGFRQELCAAIASFSTSKNLRVTYAGGGVTRADAQRSALERCNGDDRARHACAVRTTVCGDGRR
jgi:hypothetical protein